MVPTSNFSVALNNFNSVNNAIGLFCSELGKLESAIQFPCLACRHINFYLLWNGSEHFASSVVVVVMGWDGLGLGWRQSSLTIGCFWMGFSLILGVVHIHQTVVYKQA